MAIAINCNAQVKNYNPGGPKPGTYVPHINQASPSNQPANTGNVNGENQWVIGNGGWNNNGGSYGSITFGYGNTNYTNPYPQPYTGHYGNGYNIRREAKYAIRSAGHTINDAVGFHSWHDIYSPLLAKAIRHYNYSRQLYWWGNYSAALNHAERAKYLAWYSLQCFQNPGYYDNGCGNGYNQPNPYSDPYNPYYKNANPNGTESQQGAEGYRKPETGTNESIDNSLPAADVNDKELIRSFDKSSLKDE